MANSKLTEKILIGHPDPIGYQENPSIILQHINIISYIYITYGTRSRLPGLHRYP